MKSYELNSVKEIKENPEIRIVLHEADYPAYIDLIRISRVISSNPSAVSRAVINLKMREWRLACKGENGGEPESIQNEIIQQLHGMVQGNIFEKNPRGSVPKFPPRKLKKSQNKMKKYQKRGGKKLAKTKAKPRKKAAKPHKKPVKKTEGAPAKPPEGGPF